MDMTLQEIFFGGAGIVVIIMSLFQISKIEINPWSWLGSKIGKVLNGDLIDKVDDLRKDIGEIKENVHNLETTAKMLEKKIDENEAVACRSRIIRFGDELYHKVDHTKEHYDQILADITKYQFYCENNKKFKDTVAEITIDQIKHTYREVFVEGKFL